MIKGYITRTSMGKKEGRCGHEKKIVQGPFHRNFKIIHAKFWGEDNQVSKYKRQGTETKGIISVNWKGASFPSTLSFPSVP